MGEMYDPVWRDEDIASIFFPVPIFALPVERCC